MQRSTCACWLSSVAETSKTITRPRNSGSTPICGLSHKPQSSARSKAFFPLGLRNALAIWSIERFFAIEDVR